jgi:hypothetical protein
MTECGAATTNALFLSQRRSEEMTQFIFPAPAPRYSMPSAASSTFEKQPFKPLPRSQEAERPEEERRLQ